MTDPLASIIDNALRQAGGAKPGESRGDALQRLRNPMTYRRTRPESWLRWKLRRLCVRFGWMRGAARLM